MRIGIDLGGTKIEAIALDTAGATLARRRIDTPRGDYRGDPARHRRAGRRPGDRDRQPGQHRRRHPRRPVALHRAHAQRQLHLAQRSRPWTRTWPCAWDARSGSPTTPTASPCPRRPTEPRRGARSVFGVIIGTGTGGRRGHRRAPAVRTQCHRRGVGPQPPALAQPGRVPRPGLLLRQARLHRDLRLRPGPGGRLHPRHRRPHERRRDRRGGAGRRRRPPAPPWTATPTAWPGAWPASSTSSTRRS